MKTNCINCGAPIDKMSFKKCEYCGTYNLDMTMIDLVNPKPIAMVFKNKEYRISGMFVPVLSDLSVRSGGSANAALELKAIPDKDNVLLKITTGDNEDANGKTFL